MNSLQKHYDSPSTAQFCLLRKMPEAGLSERIMSASTFEGKNIPPILFGSAAANLFTEKTREITDLDYTLPEASQISIKNLESAEIKVLAIHQDSDEAISQYNMLDLASGNHVSLVLFPNLLYKKMLADSLPTNYNNESFYVIHPAFLVALKCRRIMHAKSPHDLGKSGTDKRDIREIIRSLYGDAKSFRNLERQRLISYRIREPEQELMHNVIEDIFKEVLVAE